VPYGDTWLAPSGSAARMSGQKPVMLMSATAGLGALDGGVTGSLDKPFGIDELLDAVQAGIQGDPVTLCR
jgi:hypothetical protein